MVKFFLQYLPNFPKNDRLKIAQFVHHVQNFGFEGLTARNKSSDNVRTKK